MRITRIVVTLRMRSPKCGVRIVKLYFSSAPVNWATNIFVKLNLLTFLNFLFVIFPSKRWLCPRNSLFMDGIKLAIKTKLIQSEFESFSEAAPDLHISWAHWLPWVCNLCGTMTIVTEIWQSDLNVQILPSPAHPSSLNPPELNI